MRADPLENTHWPTADGPPSGRAPSDRAPWMAAPPLPPPAEPQLHAYFDQGRSHTCTRDALWGAVSADTKNRICWVWDPDAPGWSCAEEVPWLRDAVRTREDEFLRRMRHSAAQNSIILMLPVVLSAVSGRSIASAALLLMALGGFPLLEYSWRLHQMRVETTEALARRARHARYVGWIERRTARWTWGLLIALCGVAAVQLAVAAQAGTAAAILAAGVVKPAIRDGEWWRLLTGTLLHGGLLHLLFNVLSLHSLGRIAEATFGWACAALVFALAAVAGSVCSLVLLPETTSVGASGGILGLLGFILSATWRRTPRIPELIRRELLRSALYCAVAGIAAYSVIDNAGHLGGFVAGAALGLALPRLGQIRVGGDAGFAVTVAGLAASGVVLAGVAGAIFVMTRTAFSAAG